MRVGRGRRIEHGSDVGRVREAPVGEIDVLGERQSRQTQLDGARTCELHGRARRGVPRPPGVNVVVGGRRVVHAITLVAAEFCTRAVASTQSPPSRRTVSRKPDLICTIQA